MKNQILVPLLDEMTGRPSESDPLQLLVRLEHWKALNPAIRLDIMSELPQYSAGGYLAPRDAIAVSDAIARFSGRRLISLFYRVRGVYDGSPVFGVGDGDDFVHEDDGVDDEPEEYRLPREAHKKARAMRAFGCTDVRVLLVLVRSKAQVSKEGRNR